MKLISMWEPWATLYVLGLKRIETRGWFTAYQGWLAVQATKSGLTKGELLETCCEEPFLTAMRGIVPAQPKVGFVFSLGCIIGAVEVIACHPTVRRSWLPGMFEVFPELDTPRERAFGDYSAGRYGILAAPKTFRLPTPIPFKSRQGKLLDLPAEIIIEMRKQLRIGE